MRYFKFKTKLENLLIVFSYADTQHCIDMVLIQLFVLVSSYAHVTKLQTSFALTFPNISLLHSHTHSDYLHTHIGIAAA